MNSILKKLDRIIFLLEQINSKLNARVRVPGRVVGVRLPNHSRVYTRYGSIVRSPLIK